MHDYQYTPHHFLGERGAGYILTQRGAMMPGMTMWDVYETYRIMPNLRLHQLRVAAVARTLATALKADVETITRIGLVHDMGNIMKTDFSQFPPEFYGDKGISYWEGVKKEFGERYGADEHGATAGIARELGFRESDVELLNSMGFKRSAAILSEAPLTLQILEYADQRVAPYGIVSLEERLHEGHERYKHRSRSDYGQSEKQFEENRENLRKLEKKLFANAPISPESLSEESLKGTIEQLRDYEIA